jgi:hypothetical protein
MLIKSVVSWSWNALIKSWWVPHSVGIIRSLTEPYTAAKLRFQGSKGNRSQQAYGSEKESKLLKLILNC